MSAKSKAEEDIRRHVVWMKFHKRTYLVGPSTEDHWNPERYFAEYDIRTLELRGLGGKVFKIASDPVIGEWLHKRVQVLYLSDDALIQHVPLLQAMKGLHHLEYFDENRSRAMSCECLAQLAGLLGARDVFPHLNSILLALSTTIFLSTEAMTVLARIAERPQLYDLTLHVSQGGASAHFPDVPIPSLPHVIRFATDCPMLAMLLEDLLPNPHHVDLQVTSWALTESERQYLDARLRQFLSRRPQLFSFSMHHTWPTDFTVNDAVPVLTDASECNLHMFQIEPSANGTLPFADLLLSHLRSASSALHRFVFPVRTSPELTKALMSALEHNKSITDLEIHNDVLDVPCNLLHLPLCRLHLVGIWTSSPLIAHFSSFNLRHLTTDGMRLDHMLDTIGRLDYWPCLETLHVMGHRREHEDGTSGALDLRALNRFVHDLSQRFENDQKPFPLLQDLCATLDVHGELDWHLLGSIGILKTLADNRTLTSFAIKPSLAFWFRSPSCAPHELAHAHMELLRKNRHLLSLNLPVAWRPDEIRLLADSEAFTKNGRLEIFRYIVRVAHKYQTLRFRTCVDTENSPSTAYEPEEITRLQEQVIRNRRMCMRRTEAWAAYALTCVFLRATHGHVFQGCIAPLLPHVLDLAALDQDTDDASRLLHARLAQFLLRRVIANHAGARKRKSAN